MKAFWDDRFRQEEYAYGKLPNIYFALQLARLKPGKLLLAAEGEGRNAVHAALQGWHTYAFDQSDFAKEKANRLAKEKEVDIHYEVTDCLNTHYENHFFDAIAFIYAHFPATIKSQCHQHLSTFLRPGGTVIIEAFSKRHPDYQSKYPSIGGPTDPTMLFSYEEILFDFPNFNIQELIETEVELNEGPYHRGKGSVIRFTGFKKDN